MPHVSKLNLQLREVTEIFFKLENLGIYEIRSNMRTSIE